MRVRGCALHRLISLRPLHTKPPSSHRHAVSRLRPVHACGRRGLSTVAPASSASPTRHPAGLPPSNTDRPTAESLARASSSASSPARVCIVGSGPAGMYTAKYLLKEHPNILIDIYEHLPVPFGLVRFGVAPDHPEVKVVQHDFQQTIDDPRCRFFGNVTVGSPALPLSALLSAYHATVLSYGASSARRVEVKGSHLRGVGSARRFVDWYNGHPSAMNDDVEVPGANVVVVGQGNVAIDCARLLIKGKAGMHNTDIADHALSAMASPSWHDVTRVTLIGRRGPVQSAFTTAEFRELAGLEGVKVELREDEMRVGEEDASVREMADSRPKKRKFALMKEIQQQHAASTAPRTIAFRFLLAPVEYLEDADRPGYVGAVRCQKMALVPSPSSPSSTTAVSSGQVEVLQASLVLESIGYLSTPLPGLPFDSVRAVVPSIHGRVLSSPSSPAFIPGLYVSGWLKRGPTGIIGSNIADARETVSSIVEDLRGREHEKHGMDVERVRQASGDGRLVDKEGWTRIDQWERRAGEEQGRGRVKLTSLDQMLRIAGV